MGLGEIWLDSRLYMFKISKALFNNKERVCIHVFPHTKATTVVSGYADFLGKKNHLEADVFQPNGL